MLACKLRCMVLIHLTLSILYDIVWNLNPSHDVAGTSFILTVGGSWCTLQSVSENSVASVMSFWMWLIKELHRQPEMAKGGTCKRDYAVPTQNIYKISCCYVALNQPFPQFLFDGYSLTLHNVHIFFNLYWPVSVTHYFNPPIYCRSAEPTQPRMYSSCNVAKWIWVVST